ncbi:MAG: hypothetical protein IIY12_04010, partial [Clostridia bacterium]|nr:hypothetical protein [Clostridia bacterium]
MFQDSLQKFSGFFSETEIRRQCNRSRRVSLLNGDVLGNSNSQQRGINARVLRAGRCGFASAPELDLASAERIV